MVKGIIELTKRYNSFFIGVLICCIVAELIGPIKISL